MKLGKKLIDYATLYTLGIALVLAGLLIIIVAFILLSISSAKKGKVKGGGAIIIGPVPIIFGTDRQSLKSILLLSLTLTAMLVGAIILYYLLLK